MELKPFLKWAGGKRQLLPSLLRHVPLSGFKHYYEPFVGGGALFFALRASGWKGTATLADLNERLVKTYCGVRDDVEEVIRALEKMKYGREMFLRERARQLESQADDAEMATWMIYLNRTCFNGLYRVNKAGKFNVPFGRYTNPTLCDAEGLRAASLALKRTKIQAWDFERAVRSAEAGDLVYFDPPYSPVSATADFTAYTADGFSHDDQTRLRDCALRLKKIGVIVILSNADCPAIQSLYGGGRFKIEKVEARRNINSAADKRGKVGEVIIT